MQIIIFKADTTSQNLPSVLVCYPMTDHGHDLELGVPMKKDLEKDGYPNNRHLPANPFQDNHRRDNQRENTHLEDEPQRQRCPDCPGMTRRSFLKRVGVGTAALAAAQHLPGATALADEELPPEEMVKITLRVNGRDRRLLVEPRWSLLYVLREKLGLTGTKVGCARGECGACTVLLEGQPHYACLLLAVEVDHYEITTLEGLMQGEQLGPVQQAFLEEDGYQCGYCTPGQIMAVEGLLRAHPDPELAEIQRGVSGNLCRCGAYPNIFRAARRAAELKRQGSGS